MKLLIPIFIFLVSCSTPTSKKDPLDETDPKKLNDYAVQLFENKKFEESLPYLEKAIRLFPEENKKDLALSYYNYGLALRKLNQNEKAIQAYRKSININPDNRYAYVNLGHILASDGDDIAAIAVYEKGLERFPDELYLIENLGLSYIRLKQHKKAIPLLSKAVVYRNNHPELENNELWRKRWIDYLSSDYIDR